MRFRIYSILIVFTIFSCQVKDQKLEAEENSLPNIIFILADDMGYGDIESFNENSKIPTPNLNRLAGEGMSFTNAHASAAVCTPTRYSFLTGRYSWRSKMKRGVSWIWDEPVIEEGQFTIADLLKEKGYQTALIGKWHLGWNWPTTDGESAKSNNGKNVDYTKPIEGGPTDLGFDYYFGSDVPSFPPHAFIENDKVIQLPTEQWEAGNTGAPGAMIPGWRYENLLPSLSKKAINYVETRANNLGNEPFFLFYSLSAPHTPIAPNKEYLGKSKAGRYGDFVVEIDDYIGQLMNKLDSLEMTENTMIIFTSDNGPTNMDGENYVGEVGSLLKYGHNSSSIYRGLKSDSWEAGHRVPFIARWPNVIPAKSTNTALISLVDMFSTFADIVGHQYPDSVASDSQNLMPNLKLLDSQTIRDDLIVQSGNGVLSLIENNWKLIMSSSGGGLWSGTGEHAFYDKLEDQWNNIQLYDLHNDPSEHTNVADQNEERVEKMIAKLAIYIRKGRSTDGPNLQNDGSEIWESIQWIEQVDQSSL